MADTLVTTGTDADPVSTTRANQESISDWTHRHKDAITTAGASTGPLVTTWNDEACSTTTEKGSQGEAEFINAHILEVLDEMEDCPPAGA